MLESYSWLRYLCFQAKGAESVPIFGEFGLRTQLGCIEYTCPADLRDAKSWPHRA
jgi:hypothetical protein